VERDEPVGAVIARRRQALGWTQLELEREARLPKTVVNRFERGSRQPSPTQLRRLEIVFSAYERIKTEVDALLAAM
jgi:transcriptional regulator with XRE-family HTH domain